MPRTTPLFYPPRGGRPFVFVNMSMTADGKIASANRAVSSFSSAADQRHLLELRTRADAVMCGARTVDLNAIDLGPGGANYRAERRRLGLSEYNLRIVVTGSGSLDPKAHVFRKRFSPILVLATGRASGAQLARLERVADVVRVCGEEEIDWPTTLQWLRREWKVQRLLCEGGGELNAALFAADLVDELHLTICPLILGGRDAPTIADGADVDSLLAARAFRLRAHQLVGDELLAVYVRARVSTQRARSQRASLRRLR
jgi:riboflavin-specific deaminase-like protein